MSSSVKNIVDLVNIENKNVINFTKFKKFFNSNNFNEESVNELHLKLNYKDNFYTFKYDKQFLNTTNVNHLGLFRSVIFNNYDLICFSPQKSLNSEDFFNINNLNDCTLEEYVEGTMINCFFDNNNKTWKITTKSVINAETSFSKDENITFKKMFEEAFALHNLSWSMFNRENVYSFVLQHPKNKIVCEIKQPTLYLVEVYYISNTMDNVKVKRVDYRNDASFEELLSLVEYPKIYKNEENFNIIIKKYASNNTCYNILGIMIKCGIYRLKLRNPSYEYIHNLKGNSPKLQYQYYSLRKDGKVKEFLNHFPNYKECFHVLRHNLHIVTATLWNNYISCYVNKEAPLREYGYQYRPHMIALHSKYINECIGTKKNISRTVVIDDINKLEIPRLMYLVNYNIVKKNIDKVNVEQQRHLDSK